MTSTREQLRSEISFRDEVIRGSYLNELAFFTDAMASASPARHRPRIVSVLIHGINEWPTSREMPADENVAMGTKWTARSRPGDVGGRCVAP